MAFRGTWIGIFTSLAEYTNVWIYEINKQTDSNWITVSDRDIDFTGIWNVYNYVES